MISLPITPVMVTTFLEPVLKTLLDAVLRATLAANIISAWWVKKMRITAKYAAVSDWKVGSEL